MIIFVGDGRYNRGNPIEPAEPVKELRAAYEFRLIFIPVQGNKGIDNNWFGDAFRSLVGPGMKPDVKLPVESYQDLIGLDNNFEC